tara:strand:+ start:413 stop:1183 length:771 start_codon:yes stop_codon:yes gene_type:complete
MGIKKIIYLSVCFLFFSFQGKSQAILNTETLMKEIDSSFYYSCNLEGDLQFGNINLLQFNGSFLVGKKIDNHLFRGFVNYAYLSENSSVLSSDLSSQFRYNYSINKHSLFAFFQLQNAISLRLNKRLVSGVGFRQGTLKTNKNSNYLDLAYGAFFEEEVYQESINTLVEIQNIRLSLASYSQFNIGKNNRILTVIYYQLNTQNTKDYRVYIEPRFYHDFKKMSFYIKGMYRYHSTPYIDLVNFDSDIMVGLEFKIS